MSSLKEFSIKELVVIHVCYRDVFNAPVSIRALKVWIGISNVNLQEFDTSLSELINEGAIIELNNYLACKGREQIILGQEEKYQITNQIISKGEFGLTLLSKIPWVRFVGISGSIAADNPTQDYGENHVDLDLFVVTSKNTLWLFALVERIFTNAVRLVHGHHFYCLNYITEESFLEIYNKNFYTSTELVNLKPITDKGVYNKLLLSNQWVTNYYCNTTPRPEKLVVKSSMQSTILAPINYLFFILFGLLRSMKKLNTEGVKELKTTFSANRRFNFLRISNEHGGYQESIKNKFECLFKNNFSDFYSSEVMHKLFPEEYSFEELPDPKMENSKVEKMFRKYE